MSVSDLQEPRQWTRSEMLQLKGSTQPRLYTPPLRELSPATSEGYAVIAFAALIGRPLDPWQAWLVIHAMEKLPDGRPRFRQLLVLVARQNGKTELLVILSLYWMFIRRLPLVLGTSTKLDYAQESWAKAVALAKRVPMLREDLPKTKMAGVRKANGEQTLTTLHECRYKIAAANEEGGRSLTVNRLIEDELRQHKDWSAHEAAENAMNADDWAQAWALSNQGDITAVVLDSLRKDALDFIESGKGDERLGLFEWSTLPGLATSDPVALAAANPNMNRRMSIENLIGKATRAEAAGGEQEARFRTEVLCERVRLLNPALDPVRWSRCRSDGTLDGVRRRVALVLDVAPDMLHATLAAAAILPDGRVRVEIVDAWSGPGCTITAAAELPGLIAKVRPSAFGWLPGGGAASMAAALKKRKHGSAGRRWPPSGVRVEEITAEVPAVCMGFAELVSGLQVAHSDDPLLNAHVGRTPKQITGNRWVFGVTEAGSVDATYAVAAAAHLARTMPRSVGRQRVVTVTG
jgi:hypothetical protein